MVLTIGLAGSRYLLSEDRHELAWAAFVDAMRALRERLPEPPPYRFLHPGLSSVDAFLAGQLSAAGREVSVLHLDAAADAGYAVWSLHDQVARTADGLVAIWDARVHEALFVLRAARGHRRPFEVRVLDPPDSPLVHFARQDRPAAVRPWKAVSSDELGDIDEVPQPQRRPTRDEAAGVRYDLDDPQGFTYRLS